MNDVQLYADGQLLDLYEDENIIMNLKQVDIRDIATNYSSYTQTFTIPATPKNNITLKYWFDPKNNIQVSNAGITSRLDIAGVFYKKGTLKLLSFQTNERGENKSYTIQFTTLLKALKDLFGEDMISAIDYKAIIGSDIIPFEDANIYSSFLSQITNKDIEIPLISRNRNFPNYADMAYDANVYNPRGITPSELRPAIKMSKILAGIEMSKSIKFTGGFIDSGVLSKLYMWLNKNNSSFSTGGTVIRLRGTFTNTNFIQYVPSGHSYDTYYDYFTLNLKDNKDNEIGGVWTWGYKISFSTEMQNNTTEYIGKIQEVILTSDGKVDEDATAAQTNFGIVAQSGEQRKGNQGNLVEYIWRISSEPIGTKRHFRLIGETKDGDKITMYRHNLKIGRSVVTGSWLKHYIYTDILSNFGVELKNKVTISANVPEMKVQDFLTSLIKMFNLVIIPVNETTYQLEYFSNFYGSGKIIDITKYCNPSKKINKIKTYKKLTFAHAESSYGYNIGHKAKQLPPREYGAITTEYKDGDTDEYKIESKFNIINFRELSGIDFTSNYSDDQTWIVGDGAGLNNAIVTNKPTIFYYNGKVNITESKYLAFSTAPDNNQSIPGYSMFSNLDNVVNPTMSLSFATERMLDRTITQTLFSNGYDDLVKSIYSNYAREYEIEAKLPKHIYSTLSLNNQIIISNENYSISDIQINIMTGDTKLKLNNIIR